MSNWLEPNTETLREVVSASKGRLLLCSPYISTPALSIVASALPRPVSAVEIWTRLDVRDWLTGASDPEGILDFVHQMGRNGGSVAIRYSNNLHAKIVASDGPKAMAGSANLTAGGYMRNLEVARVVTGREVEQVRELVDLMRPKLSRISLDRFAQFVSECTAIEGTKEALLDLIRQETPQLTVGAGALMPYGQFLAVLEANSDPLAKDILHIAKNLDGNNNTGKVKQAFFGVQRFIQEYPRHRMFVESLPLQWFDVAASSLSEDWEKFLDDFSSEVNSDFGYSSQRSEDICLRRMAAR